MATWTVLCWQEIPSMVQARGGDGTHKVQLSARFQELIDLVAMRRDLAGGEDYLLHWRREPARERDGDARAVAEAVAAEIEARYGDIRAQALADRAR